MKCKKTKTIFSPRPLSVGREHRRAESWFWAVFIIAVYRAFVLLLGLGARHRGIVELSRDEGVVRMCDSVRLLFFRLLLLSAGCVQRES